MSLTDFIKRHQVSSFFFIAFVYFWLWEGILYIIFPWGPGGVINAGVLVIFFVVLAATASGVTGVILSYIIDGRQGISEMVNRLSLWRASVKWYAAALFTMGIAITVALLILSITISTEFLPTFLAGQNIIMLIPLGAMIGLIAGFIEEPGWTGFALPRLLARFSPFYAAFILGIVHAIWHIFPYFLGMPSPYTALDITSGLIWISALIPLRILITWVYVNSKGSLFLAMIMHASYDASLYVLVPASSLSQLQTAQFYGVLNVVLWVAVASVVIIFGAKKLAQVTS